MLHGNVAIYAHLDLTFLLINQKKKHCTFAIPSQYNYIQQKSEELALNNQELKEKRKKNAAKRKSKDMEAEENELED